jgi:hypothetical protein
VKSSEVAWPSEVEVAIVSNFGLLASDWPGLWGRALANTTTMHVSTDFSMD